MFEPNTEHLAQKLRRYRRFNIVGTSGSGKTTFSARLAKNLKLRHIEMDALFWKPNWQESSDDEFFAKLRDVLGRDAWVLDGNYSRTLSLKWETVECVIWLDYSFSRTLYQAFSRAIKRSFNKQELWPGTGNRERFRTTFLSKDSILLWTLTHLASNRRKYQQLASDPAYQHIIFVRLSSPRQSEQLLKRLTTPL